MEILEETNPEQQKQPSWIIGMIVSVITFSILFTLIAFASMVFINVAPEETYESIQTGDWRFLNVNVMALNKPQDFIKTEQALLIRVHHSSETSNPIPHYLLGELYETIDQPRKAIYSYQEALHQGESSWLNRILYSKFLQSAHAKLALLYYLNHQPQPSLQELNQIKNADHPFSDQPHPELLEALKNSLEEPDRADFRFDLGKALREIIKLKEARQELKIAARLSIDPTLKNQAENFIKIKMPKEEFNLSPMGRYYTLSGAHFEHEENYLGKAAKLYQKAIQEAPRFEWPYQQLAVIYYDMKRYQQASYFAQKALSINPNFYSPYLTLGDVEIDLKHYDKALVNYQKAVSLSNQLADEDESELMANIQNQMGFASEALGKREQALEHYKKAYELAEEDSSDYVYADSALDRLKQAKAFQ